MAWSSQLLHTIANLVTSDQNPRLYMVDGSVYAKTAGGRLFSVTLGGLTQLAPPITNTSALIDSRLISHGGVLYHSDADPGKGVRYVSAGSWVLHTSWFWAGLASLGGVLYGSFESDYQLRYWLSGGTWPLLVAAPQVHPFFPFNNKLYGEGLGDGILYEYNGSNAWVAKSGPIAPWSSAEIGGTLYAVTTGSSVYRWNGTDAWELLVSGVFNNDFRACVHQGSIYLIGPIVDPRNLYRWTPGESSWTLLQSQVLASYVLSLGSDGTTLFAMGNNTAGYREVYRFYEVLPSASRIFPASTGKPSHVRIMRGHRSPADAETFHNLVKEAT